MAGARASSLVRPLARAFMHVASGESVHPELLVPE